MKKKILVILGQTAAGKSNLAVKAAKKFGGEIVSADSRQVYKGLDIGTEKITKSEMNGIPHHLIDVANPKKKFSVAEYKKLATEKIDEIHKRGKLPIIVGGTGFYIQSIVYGITYPEVKPDESLRDNLNEKSISSLVKILKNLDPNRLKTIDIKNKRRLIRAIEISKNLGRVPKIKRNQKYEVLQIGLKIKSEELKKKIIKRLDEGMRRGLLSEVKKLNKNGLSWSRMEELGLEYKYVSWYLREEINLEDMLNKLASAIWQYSKRQKTWFKRDKKIKWFDLEEEKIFKTIQKFLD